MNVHIPLEVYRDIGGTLYVPQEPIIEMEPSDFEFDAADLELFTRLFYITSGDPFRPLEMWQVWFAISPFLGKS